MPRELWYTETGYFSSSNYRLTFRVKNLIHEEKTPYQTIEIIDTYAFGKMLLLDGIIMLTDQDEHTYHEMLVHPAMTVHPNPENVLIIGGGDGGTVRELLKHDVKKITLVDIDERVIEVSKKYFPQFSSGFSDPRLEIKNQDGALYVKEDHKYDIIFLDSTDPTGPGAALVNDSFLRDGSRSLASDDSIWVAQTEATFVGQEFLAEYTSNLRKMFGIVQTYWADIPSYGGGWTFTFASQKTDPLTPVRKPPSGLKYYSPEIHKACFVLPEYLRSIVSP
jgi:spermidine synthase